MLPRGIDGNNSERRKAIVSALEQYEPIRVVYSPCQHVTQMRPDLWRQAEELFHAALEQSPKERRAFLDSACVQNTELRRYVELLVLAEEKAGSFLNKDGL